MKATAAIATSLAFSALLVPSAFANQANAKAPLRNSKQIDDILKVTPGFEGVKKVHAALTLRESTEDYNKMHQELLYISRYTHTKRQDYEDVWRVLLVDLVDPALADKLVASMDVTSDVAVQNFQDYSDAVLLVASQKGLNSTDLAPAVVLAQAKIAALNGTVVTPPATEDKDKPKEAEDKDKPKEAEDKDKPKEEEDKTKTAEVAKEDPKVEKDRENFMYKFCSTLTHTSKQFLLANSSIYNVSSTFKRAGETEQERFVSQNDIVLSVLDLCKAHLGDARTLAASALFSTAAAAAVVFSFI